MTKEEVINKLHEKIKELPDGTETCISQLLYEMFPNQEFKTGDLFDIEIAIHEKANNEGIIFDKSKYAGQKVGLPFNISFVIKKDSDKIRTEKLKKENYK